MALIWKGGALACAVLVLQGPASGRARTDAPRQASGARPFTVGERAEYNVRFAWFNAGGASMEVVAIDTLRGRDVYHFRWVVQGGVNALVFRYHLRDTLMSWTDTARFVSLRYIHNKTEGGKKSLDHIELFPDRLIYIENNDTAVPTVPDPLDEIAFMYFVRTLPLNVGDSLAFPRYFKPNRNPVRLMVLRKETINVPAGKFKTIVVHPVFKARGMFSEGGNAEVWLADDSTRAVVQIKTHLSFGSLTMQLKSYRATNPAVPAPAR